MQAPTNTRTIGSCIRECQCRFSANVSLGSSQPHSCELLQLVPTGASAISCSVAADASHTLNSAARRAHDALTAKAFEVVDGARDWCVKALRTRHPDASTEQVRNCSQLPNAHVSLLRGHRRSVPPVTTTFLLSCQPTATSQCSALRRHCDVRFFWTAGRNGLKQPGVAYALSQTTSAALCSTPIRSLKRPERADIADVKCIC